MVAARWLPSGPTRATTGVPSGPVTATGFKTAVTRFVGVVDGDDVLALDASAVATDVVVEEASTPSPGVEDDRDAAVLVVDAAVEVTVVDVAVLIVATAVVFVASVGIDLT